MIRIRRARSNAVAAAAPVAGPWLTGSRRGAPFTPPRPHRSPPQHRRSRCPPAGLPPRAAAGAESTTTGRRPPATGHLRHVFSARMVAPWPAGRRQEADRRSTSCRPTTRSKDFFITVPKAAFAAGCHRTTTGARTSRRKTDRLRRPDRPRTVPPGTWDGRAHPECLLNPHRRLLTSGRTAPSAFSHRCTRRAGPTSTAAECRLLEFLRVGYQQQGGSEALSFFGDALTQPRDCEDQMNRHVNEGHGRASSGVPGSRRRTFL